MGIVRVLLAISVVLAHSYGYLLVGGKNAVQIFYLISGYLISYVLTEGINYNGRIRSFYLNRFLRLYPVYLVVALVTLVAYVSFPSIQPNSEFLNTFKAAPLSGVVLLGIANFTLLFQDWIMFLGVDSGNLVFTRQFNDSDLVLWHGLLVPQAWSIGVEISFYILAPFLLRRNKILFTALFISLTIRLLLFIDGVGFMDPWLYRFFPAELSLFLMGAVAHKFIKPFFQSYLTQQKFEKISWFLTIVTVIVISLYWKIVPNESFYFSYGLFAYVILSLPFLFEFSRKYSFDRKIGDLSYPIYIVHFLIIRSVDAVFYRISFQGLIERQLAILTLTIFTSVVLLKVIANPMEKIRSEIKRRELLVEA